MIAFVKKCWVWIQKRWAFWIWVPMFVCAVLWGLSSYAEEQFWQSWVPAGIVSTIVYGALVYLILSLTGKIPTRVFSLIAILLFFHWIFLVFALLLIYGVLSSVIPNSHDYRYIVGSLLIASSLILIVDRVIISPGSEADDDMRNWHEKAFWSSDLPICLGFLVLLGFACLIHKYQMAKIECNPECKVEWRAQAFFAGAAALQLIFSSTVYALISWRKE